jgi:serine/threonine-protein kinase
MREVVRERLLGMTSAEQPSAAVHLDHLHAVTQREDEDTAQRLRTAALVGLCLWPPFLLLDHLVARGDPEMLSSLLFLRLAGCALSLASFLSLRKARGGSLAVEVSRVSGFVAACVLIALQSVQVDGIAGAYAPGIMLAIMLRASFVAEPWRRGLVAYVLMWLAFPATVLAVSAFDARVAVQLRDAGALAGFALPNFFCLTAAMTGMICSNALWRLRREAYEARHLGRYRLKQRIGRGGMGEVWVAYHLGLRLDIALKILSSGLSNERDAVARFEREVLAISRLSHPNTVRILDHGVTTEGIWYYAMELLQGSDLRGVIERDGPLPAERAVALMTQVCGSLAEAHAKGVIHRDLKPSNIFVVTASGEPDFIKVFDFGLAKLTQDSESAQLTRDGAVLGTPRYMAPETLQHGAVSARSDVYSLGCVLYEMLAGCPPFEDDSLRGLLEQHRAQAPRPPSGKRGQALPEALEAIVLRCLAKDPDDRFRDASELGAALARLPLP